MAVRKIQNSWWVDFRADYMRYRKRSPENTKAGAEAYEALLRQKLARGESIEKVPDAERPQTFEELAWQWFDEYVLPNNKFIEQRSKKYILTSTLIPFFGKLPVGKIAAHHIEQYKALQVREGVTNKTIKNRLTILNKCLVMASIPGTSINRDLASP